VVSVHSGLPLTRMYYECTVLEVASNWSPDRIKIEKDAEEISMEIVVLF